MARKKAAERSACDIDARWLRGIGFKRHSQESAGWYCISAGRMKLLVVKASPPCRAIVEFHDDSMFDTTQIVRLPYAETRQQLLDMCKVLGAQTRKSP